MADSVQQTDKPNQAEQWSINLLDLAAEIDAALQQYRYWGHTLTNVESRPSVLNIRTGESSVKTVGTDITLADLPEEMQVHLLSHMLNSAGLTYSKCWQQVQSLTACVLAAINIQQVQGKEENV